MRALRHRFRLLFPVHKFDIINCLNAFCHHIFKNVLKNLFEFELLLSFLSSVDGHVKPQRAASITVNQSSLVF